MSFVMFVYLESAEGLVVWQRIAFLFCESEAFMDGRRAEFAEFLKAFYLMLKQLPRDFFFHELTKDHFMVTSVRHLLENLGAKQEYRPYFDEFDKLMAKHFEFDYAEVVWNSESMEGHANELLDKEEMPVVVGEREAYISFD